MKFRWRRCVVGLVVLTLIAVAIIPNFLRLLYLDGNQRKPEVLYFQSKRGVSMNDCVATAEDVINLRERIIRMAKALKRAKSHTRGAKTDGYLQMAMDEMHSVLTMLQISPDNVQVHHEGESTSVCPETYKGSTYGYPFFNKGFETVDCSHNKSLLSLLTILIPTFDITIEPLWDSYQKIIKQITLAYGNVPIMIGIKEFVHYRERESLPDFVALKTFPVNATVGSILNSLLAQVRTKFALIARDLINFTDDARPERLIREIERLNTSVAGGASRDQNGRWRPGCYQRVFRNFSLFLEEGYDVSLHECMFCDHIDSPFIIKTDVAKSILFDETITGLGVFEDFFMRIGKKDYNSIVCPDSMFHVNRSLQNNKTLWHSFADKWNIHSLRIDSDVDIAFSCDEYTSNRKCHMDVGYALHPCCLQELSDLIKFILRYCESNNIICELQEGTLLGAVKFGKVLPWERDGDLTFLSANYSVLQGIAPSAKRAGYTFRDDGGQWCCADNRTAGGVILIGSRHWQVQMYGQHMMDSELLQTDGLTPTTMLFDGEWVKVPRNPGLHARNRYGHEIYAHAEHWMSLKLKSGWINYKTRQFTKCEETNRHDCLDQYNADGNLQFKKVLP